MTVIQKKEYLVVNFPISMWKETSVTAFTSAQILLFIFDLYYEFPVSHQNCEKQIIADPFYALLTCQIGQRGATVKSKELPQKWLRNWSLSPMMYVWES